jgi:hypothetical protein
MQCLSMITVCHGEFRHKVPCGKCAFCLTNKRSQWMFRIFHEMRAQSNPGWFLTFTYDEKHVKRVADGRLSLRFRDIQLYVKRLRKLKFYVKYVCVGEYGGQTHRPHYHMLLWTDASTDVLSSEWKSSKDGSPMGIVHFGRISMQSAMYCLKYIIQPKQRAVDGIEKTRAQFSQGLGISYMSTAVYNYHTEDYESPVMFSYVDGRKVSLPRYYRNKIFTKFQLRREGSKAKWNSIREHRKQMRSLLAQGVKSTSAYMQSLRVEQAKRIISSTKFKQLL